MAQVTFTLSELEELTKNRDSGVTLIPNCVRPLLLSPFQLQDLKNCIKTYLYSSVAKYDPLLDGIILSYKRIKIEDFFSIQHDGRSKFHYTADIYVFKPKTGSVLSGVINKKGPDHLGCLVHRVFNIAIPRPDNLSNDESWIGSRLKIGQEVQFRVVDVDLNEDMPYIKGELIDQPGTCESDNYTVEDMEIEDDSGSNGERTECVKCSGTEFVKQTIQYEKEIFELAKDTSSKTKDYDDGYESINSNTNIYSYAQLYMKNYYCKYRTLFSKMAGRVLNLPQPKSFYRQSRCTSNSRDESINLCILILCDFMNYAYIFSTSISDDNTVPEEPPGKLIIMNSDDDDDDNRSESRKRKKKKKKKKRKKDDPGTVVTGKVNYNRKKDENKLDKKEKSTKNRKSDFRMHDFECNEQVLKRTNRKRKIDDINVDERKELSIDDDVTIIKEIKINKTKKDDNDIIIVKEIKRNEDRKCKSEVIVTDNNEKEKSRSDVGTIDLYSSFLDRTMNSNNLLRKDKIFHRDKEEKAENNSSFIDALIDFKNLLKKNKVDHQNDEDRTKHKKKKKKKKK